MSLDNRYLKYSEDITEEVYNEVIEVLKENGKNSYDNLTAYSDFMFYRLLKIYTRRYMCDTHVYRMNKEVTVSEILKYKKNIEHQETMED